MGMMMYKEFAKYYDKMYSFKDYKKDSADLKALIIKHKKSKGKRLLDIACGTGKHLQFLKRWYDCTGVDLNKEMLRIARKSVKGVTFRQADMLTFKLKGKYDVITCLFSSIGHLGTKAKTVKAVKNMAAHLAPGGVLIIEPWVLLHQAKDHYPHMVTYEDDDLKMARVSYSRQKGRKSLIHYHYAIVERGKGVQSYEERETMTLLTKDELVKMASDAGLKARYMTQSATGRGLLVGVKPPA